MKVVVIGGGYAGLATIIGLRQSVPEAEIHLVDPSLYHLKTTGLHRTLHSPLNEHRKPFAELSERFGFTHHRAAPAFDENDLSSWQRDKTIPLGKDALTFDYLVIATGAKPRQLAKGHGVYTQQDFSEREGRDILTEFLARTNNNNRFISIVGGGATSLQFLSELDHWLKRNGIQSRLRLINGHKTLLPTLPRAFHNYIRKRLRTAGIDYLPHTRYTGQDNGEIGLQDVNSGKSYTLPSSLTLLFPGVAPHPRQLSANRYGRVMIGDQLLWNIFAAGDCARFASSGLNALTAQAAIRKGKQIAINIKRIQQGRLPRIYAYSELGYFVSLGPQDAIGWSISKNAILKGFSAHTVKTAVETRYDLFVTGVDTFF